MTNSRFKKLTGFTLIELLVVVSIILRQKLGLFRRITKLRPGFTLIELLVVVSIIGILITLVTVAILPIQRKGRDSKRKADINLMQSGLDLFKADFKIYPNSTFYLGSYGTTLNGGGNSNWALGADLPTCNPLSNGDTALFTSDGLDHSAAEFDANPINLKPGFASVNHFLICLKYMNQTVSDPTSGLTSNNLYHYRVSYDYTDMILATTLENANDKDAAQLFNQTVAKRYYAGSGKNIRHLDEDSDTPQLLGGFYTSATGTLTDGKYLYQCAKRSSDQNVISRDDRSSSAYEPVKFNPINSGYIKNSACAEAPLGSGLDAIASY